MQKLLLNMQELIHQNHFVVYPWYSNSYGTEQKSKRIEYLFQLYLKGPKAQHTYYIAA